ncbi:MAG: VOC family protein [Sphingobium sp.]
MSQNPVGWFEIYVDDMKRAKAFYEAVFHFTLDPMPMPGMELEMFTFPMHQGGSGAAGALVKMDGVKAGGGGTLVYFNCADCAVEQGRVAGAGGKVFKEKFSIGEFGFIALVVDTEGNMIGLHSKA